MSLPLRLDWNKSSDLWASDLNPVINNPIVSGNQLTNISLAVGSNTINHKLGRKYQGYLITGMHGVFSQIFDTVSPLPALTLVLHSSAATSVDIYVY